MPNWTYNYLTIQGNPTSIAKIKNQLNKPYTHYVESHGDLNFSIKEVNVSNPVFAFWNIINPFDMGITKEEYCQQPKRSELSVNDPNWWSDTNKVSLTDNSWYAWNNREWGTKWDVAVSDDEKYPETELDEDNSNDTTLYYRFNTPWSPPVPVIEKLASQYPELTINLSYEEETGWGGEIEFHGEESSVIEEYDNKCRECDNLNCLSWCEECSGEFCRECGYCEEDPECKHVDDEGRGVVESDKKETV